jgi:hypothetical protein
MQGIGHAAIVNYCKWPITQQIRPQDDPEGFACFEFFLLIILMELFLMNINYNLLWLLILLEQFKTANAIFRYHSAIGLRAAPALGIVALIIVKYTQLSMK